MGIKASAQYTITEINEEYSVVISNESHVFRADKNNTVVASNTSIQIYGYQGSTQIATKVGTISGLPSAGMTATIKNNSSTNTSITIAVTTALTSSVANSGTLTIPITVGNKTINKVFSWTKAQTGATGATGSSGTSAYVHIRYSDDNLKFTGNGGQDLGAFIGVCSTNSSTAPTTFSSYKWSKLSDYAGLNKWKVDVYTKTTVSGNGSVPTMENLLANETFKTSFLIKDSQSTTWGYGDNFLAVVTTYAYFTEAYTMNTTAKSDDASSIYLNDTKIYDLASCQKTSVTINFVKGWNKIQFLMNEQAGDEYAYFSQKISELEKVKFMSAYEEDKTKVGEQGLKGDTGATGTTARTYWLSSNATTITRSMSKTLTPSTITFNSYYRDGNSATVTAYSGRFIIQESTNGTSWTTKYTSSTNESTKTYTPTNTTNLVKCTMYVAGGTSTALDSVTVGIIDSIDDLQVGGRNLQRGTEFWNSDCFLDKGGAIVTDNILCVPVNKYPKCSFVELVRGEQYTVSVYIKSDTKHNETNYGPLLLDYVDNENNRVSYQWAKIATVITEDWLRYSYTFTCPNDENIAGICLGPRSSNNYINYFKYLKIEKGNIMTDWTPAPEDVENEILQRPTQEAVTDQISQSLKNATGSIDKTIAEKIGQSRTEIVKSMDKKIEAANKSVKQEIDNTTGEKIRDLEYFASQMTLKGNEFSIGIEKTKGVNLIKNSVMKQHKERGGSGANSKNIKANFWLNNSLSEDYFPNIIYGEDSLSRSNTDSGNYFRFNLVSSNNTQLDYIFSDPIDFKKNTSNIILSYKLRQMQKITNGVFFIGLVFYRQDTSATGMGAVSKTAGIPTGYYVPITEYSNTNLTGSFSGDYIYKTMPITRQGNIKVEETVEVKETISNGNVTERYVNLTYTPSSSNPTVNVLSYGSGAIEHFKATNKKVVLRLTDTRKVVTVQYTRDLQNFVAMDSPTDAKIKAALANIPVSEVTIYYNSSSKKIWTYNPFTGAFIETSNLYDTTVTDTNINTVRVVMGVRSTNSSAITGQIDISDVKLEYDSVSTIWTQNVGETYSKQYKMDEKGFSISSDTNTMFIDEDEIAAYKSNENGKLDMNNPVFQIKEDETILRQTTIYDQLNIENTNETRADAFVMKQQLIGGKWYFIFY